MEGFMEVELMVTKRDDNRQGESRAICLWKMDWQSFAIPVLPSALESGAGMSERHLKGSDNTKLVPIDQIGQHSTLYIEH